MKTYVLLVCAFVSTYCKCSGQASDDKPVSLRPEITKLVQNIAADNVVKGAAVGIAGIRTEQWDRYEHLKRTATGDELMLLSSHTNPVVRCYAFQALVHRKVDVFPILLQHLKDDERVETLEGCIGGTEKVGDYFINTVMPGYADEGSYEMSARQLTELDSILINDKTVKVSRKESLLSTIRPNQKFYKQIRELAIQGNPEAVLGLARFRNPLDIDIIKNLFSDNENSYYAIYAAREFPHESFYPYLVAAFENEWSQKLYSYPKWRIIYQALAKYPTTETYELFDRTINTNNNFRSQTLGTYLLIALNKYPSPIFEPLKTRIKLDQYHLGEVEDEKDIEK